MGGDAGISEFLGSLLLLTGMLGALLGLAALLQWFARRPNAQVLRSSASYQIPGRAPAVPAGWYPDPGDANQHRYWDGEKWTSSLWSENTDGAVAFRANQQQQWITEGDIRGIYGEEGAQLMRSIIEPPRPPLGNRAELAAVAHTESELEALIKQQLPMWAHTAFISVMVQRRDALQPRLLEVRLGFAEPTATRGNPLDGGVLLAGEIDRYIVLSEQVMSVMLSPAVRTMFDLEERDSGVILHAAHRLMDYHEEFLQIAERTRRIAVTSSCSQLQKGLWELVIGRLAAYDEFIEGFIDCLKRGEDGLRYGSGEVELGVIGLRVGMSPTAKQDLLDLKEWAFRL